MSDIHRTHTEETHVWLDLSRTSQDITVGQLREFLAALDEAGFGDDGRVCYSNDLSPRLAASWSRPIGPTPEATR